MPKDSVYPIEQLKKLQLSDSEQNKLEQTPTNSYSYTDDKIYLAADLQANSAVSKKRKFVCLEVSSNGLAVKKYDHKTFKESSVPNGSKIVNKKHLVLYVKGNEQEQCFSEMQDIVGESFDLTLDATLDKIKSHFKGFWINTKEFDSYGDMKRAFDEKTGEYINNSVIDLGKIYQAIEKKYTEYLNEYKDIPEEFSLILDKMKEILGKMNEIYEKNINDFQHRSTNTVSPVAKSFEILVAEFNEQTKQLEINNNNVNNKVKINQLESNLIKLQTDCENAIPSGTTSTEEIFEERKIIKGKVDLCLFTIQDLKNHAISDTTIKGVEEKFKSLEKEYDGLTMKLNSLEEENTQDIQKDIPKETEPLFSQLVAILEEFKNHKTDGTKEKIKEDLIKEIRGILSCQESSSDELANVINKANEFILKNKAAANAYTGGAVGKLFGKGKSVLGDLMHKLQELLDKFLTVLTVNHKNGDSSTPSMSSGRV